MLVQRAKWLEANLWLVVLKDSGWEKILDGGLQCEGLDSDPKYRVTDGFIGWLYKWIQKQTTSN